MKTSDFDFDLPEELIAQEPLAERDASRLMYLPLGSAAWSHHHFRDLPELLRAGDLLVLNDARVIPARLQGHKRATGGRVELLLCDPLPPMGERAVWRCMGQSSKPLRTGAELVFGELSATVLEAEGEGFFRVAFDAAPEKFLEAVEVVGQIPLPPYIQREAGPRDRERYQTVYARQPGAVAAPTAGLHFTARIFDELRRRGVRIESLSLFVGPGTFLPVRIEDPSEHRMHAERFEIPVATARAIAETRATGGRVIAVGTTTLRALETAWDGGSGVNPGPGVSNLFVRPGHVFRVIDGLITNFHLPRSTLVMLVAALCGRERLLSAYADAVRHRYRFYSYGDAMLVL